MNYPWNTVYDLADFTFIAGTEQEFTFDIYDSGSAPLSLNSTTCTWELSHYASASSVLTKSGTTSGSSNRMTVILDSVDTAGLSGRFVHQPVIAMIGGSVIYRPSQGLITIAPRIA
jgi:hypothetical protein